MNQQVNHSGSLTLEGLQKSLWLAEAGVHKLIKIEVAGTKTLSTHDNATHVPRRSLVLVEDNDQGTTKAPDGTQPEPVCRGEALISGAKKKVAAFRKKAA
jgi:hypothetical protein